MRRNWIKIYVHQCLRGTMMDEMEDPGERWVWFGFLLLAGDSAYEGEIKLTEEMGFTDEQLAALLKCSVEVLVSAKDKMIKHDKIKVDDRNIIKIVNWKRYQSEYDRQKKYRSDKEKLQPKVIPKSNNKKSSVERDRERDRDKKEKKNSIAGMTEEKALETFKKIWGWWWRKEDKPKAMEKFLALVFTHGIHPDRIKKACIGYLRCEKSKGTTKWFIKYLKTFLYAGNKKRKIPGTWEAFEKYGDDKYKLKDKL